MATKREIKRRITSVKNISKTTKAMEMIATTRLKRAQQRVLASRPYATALRGLLQSLAAYTHGSGEQMHPLLARHPEIRRVGIVNITPDRGLCGSLITNVNRLTTNFILDEEQGGHKISLLSIGKRGRDFFVRRGRELRAELSPVSTDVSLIDIVPIARVVIEDYTNGYFDEVYISTTDFINTMSQKPRMVKLLPVEPSQEASGIGEIEGAEEIEVPHARQEYVFEPDEQAVLAEILPRFVEVQIYQAVLESIASEQSAKMVAMRNATDNAKELVSELTLELNKARQAGITRELAEISAAATALG